MPSFTLPPKDIGAREIAIKISQCENIQFDPDTTDGFGPVSCERTPEQSHSYGVPFVYNKWNSFRVRDRYFNVIISNYSNADGSHAITYTSVNL